MGNHQNTESGNLLPGAAIGGIDLSGSRLSVNPLDSIGISRREAPLALAERFPSVNCICLDELFRTNPVRAEQLLSDYYPAYERAFPDSDERLDRPTLHRIISDPTNTWDIAVYLEGDRIVAGYHTLLGKLGDNLISLGDYLWVDAEYRGKGLSVAIYQETIQARRKMGAVYHFGEINDPALMTQEHINLDREAGVDPIARLRFWAKMGRLAVDAPWVQPALRRDSHEVYHLLLSVARISASAPDKIGRDDFLKLWRIFYEPLQSNGTLERAYRRLEASLGPVQEIPFIPLTKQRLFVADGRMPPF